jgi:hypothetical protein
MPDILRKIAGASSPASLPSRYRGPSPYVEHGKQEEKTMDVGTRAHSRAGSKEQTISNIFQLGRIYEVAAGVAVTRGAEDARSV